MLPFSVFCSQNVFVNFQKKIYCYLGLEIRTLTSVEKLKKDLTRQDRIISGEERYTFSLDPTFTFIKFLSMHMKRSLSEI